MSTTTRFRKSFGAVRKLDLWLTEYKGTLPQLSKVQRLEELKLGVIDVRDALRRLASAPKLRALELCPMDEDIFGKRYELAAEIGGLRRLEHFEMEVNPPIRLPASIGKLKKLRSLQLGNRFDKLPNEIGGLASLEELELNNYDPIKLPPVIGKLKKLRVLTVRCVTRDGLPSTIGGLAALEELSIWAPHNSTLPASIGNLKRLRRLRVWTRALPASIVNCSALEELEWNSIPALNAKVLALLARLPALRVLRFSCDAKVDFAALGRALAGLKLEVLKCGIGFADKVGPDFAKLTNLRRLECNKSGAKDIKPFLPPGRWRKTIKRHDATYERTSP